jgi:hypothetical protein
MKIWEPKPPGILWPTPGPLRDEFTFRKVETVRVVGGQKGLAVVAVCPFQSKRVFVQFLNSRHFLTLTVLDLLNLAGEDG